MADNREFSKAASGFNSSDSNNQLQIEGLRIIWCGRLFGEIISHKEKYDRVAKGNSNKPQTRYTIVNGDKYLSEDGEWVKDESLAKVFDFKKDIKVWLENYFSGTPTPELDLFPEFTVQPDNDQQPQNNEVNPWRGVEDEFLKSGIPVEVTRCCVEVYPQGDEGLAKKLLVRKLQAGQILDDDHRYFKNYFDGGWIAKNSKLDSTPNEFTCAKLNTPTLDPKTLKPRKYECPTGIKTSKNSDYYLFPDFDNPSVLRELITGIIKKHNLQLNPENYNSYAAFFKDAKKDVYIDLTEGFKKDVKLIYEELLGFGLTSVSTWGCKENGQTWLNFDGFKALHPKLKEIFSGSKGIIIDFDCDKNQTTIRNVNKQCTDLALAITVELGIPVYRRIWDSDLGKGIDDLFANGKGLDDTQLVEIDISEYFQDEGVKFEQENKKKTDKKNQAKEQIKQQYRELEYSIKALCGTKLRYNELTLDLDESFEYDLETLYLDIQSEYGIAANKTKVYDLAVKIAKENSYHPVRDYLNHCADNVKPVNINNLAEVFFGNNDPLHNEMVKKTLISAVARIFKPGCKVDTCLTLKGNQGVLKSTFFRELFGDDWFTDSVNLQKDNKDELLKAHRNWCCELAELETVTSKRVSGELKNHLSQKADDIREPFARKTKRMRRQHIYVASVNEDCFLTDATGSRRYWVVPVNKVIDIFKLKIYRDAIWAGAVQAYRNNEQWWFTYDDEAIIHELNEIYEHQDSWTEKIATWLNTIPNDDVTTYEILTESLEFEPSRISKRDEMRIARIMKDLGYPKIKKYNPRTKKRQHCFDLTINLQDNSASNLDTHTNNRLDKTEPAPDKDLSNLDNLDNLSGELFPKNENEKNGDHELKDQHQPISEKIEKKVEKQDSEKGCVRLDRLDAPAPDKDSSVSNLDNRLDKIERLSTRLDKTEPALDKDLSNLSNRDQRLDKIERLDTIWDTTNFDDNTKNLDKTDPASQSSPESKSNGSSHHQGHHPSSPSTSPVTPPPEKPEKYEKGDLVKLCYPKLPDFDGRTGKVVEVSSKGDYLLELDDGRRFTTQAQYLEPIGWVKYLDGGLGVIVTTLYLLREIVADENYYLLHYTRLYTEKSELLAASFELKRSEYNCLKLMIKKLNEHKYQIDDVAFLASLSGIENARKGNLID